ncbi:MAG: hypothetical protein ACRDQ5_24195 [Sciscionella sp.]
MLMTAQRCRERATAQFHQAMAVEQVAVPVRGISMILANTAWAECTVVVPDPELRTPIAEAMGTLEALR